MTSTEFQNGLAELEKHLFELDDASRGMVDDFFKMMKTVQTPFIRRDWYCWIQHEGDWYYVNAYQAYNGKVICVDNRGVVKELNEKPQSEREPYDATAVLAELTEAVGRSVDRALRGEYLTWVNENLPLSCRSGRIRLNSVSPESKALMAGAGTTLTDAEKEEFLSYGEHGYRIIGDQIFYSDMCAGVYFHMYACVAKECGLEGADSLPDRELFFKYYAGSSESGLEEMDENDAPMFTGWYDSKKQGGNVYYTFCGNYDLPAAIALCQDETGYFVKLHSGVPEGNPQLVRFYNALVRAGYPVYIENANELLAWIREDYVIAIEPARNMRYLKGNRRNNCFHAFVEYESLPNDELKEAVVWLEEQELVPAEVKQ